jgi:ARMET, C-terminal
VKITPQTDFSRLKVGQLKELLRDRGISCRDCFEKADFISKLRELAAAQT